MHTSYFQPQNSYVRKLQYLCKKTKRRLDPAAHTYRVKDLNRTISGISIFTPRNPENFQSNVKTTQARNENFVVVVDVEPAFELKIKPATKRRQSIFENYLNGVYGAS